jgi:hypothetical protein
VKTAVAAPLVGKTVVAALAGAGELALDLYFYFRRRRRLQRLSRLVEGLRLLNLRYACDFCRMEEVKQLLYTEWDSSWIGRLAGGLRVVSSRRVVGGNYRVANGVLVVRLDFSVINNQIYNPMSSSVMVIFKATTPKEIIKAEADKILAMGGTIGHRFVVTSVNARQDMRKL